MPALKTITDPAGQFTIQIPTDWAPEPSSGSFSGPDGFVHTGYLPEMTYMQTVQQVCESLANGPLHGWLPGLTNFQKASNCSLAEGSWEAPRTVRIILQNVLAQPDQRFFYLEADAAHIDAILASLNFTHPFPFSQIGMTMTYPMRPADQSFWDTARQFPPGMAVADYPLTPEKPEPPGKTIIDELDKHIPIEKTQVWRYAEPMTYDAIVSATLQRFGYRLVPSDQNQNGLPTYVIFRGEEKILDGIRSFDPIAVSESGRDFAIVVSTTRGETLLVRSNQISPWNQDTNKQIIRDPLFDGEDLIELVWNSSTEEIQVLKGNTPIYSRVIVFGAQPPVFLFTQWGSHWLLEVDGVMIQDGIDLNQSLGYDEIFGWDLLDGKPVYFFRKGAKVGISYDGKILPVAYDEVFHHGCCGFAANNPYAINRYEFVYFALRDGMWYGVELGFK
jgi:hypothetical protein